MPKLIAILIVNGKNLADDISDINIRYLINEVTLLNYVINKVTAIQSEDDLIISEISNLMKQNDFVLLIDKSQTPLTYKYLDAVFNLHNCENGHIYPRYTKLLTYENSIKLEPIVYLSRLFFIKDKDQNLKLLFDYILKGYLKQFNKERIFIKTIKLESCEVNQLPIERDGCVEIENYMDGAVQCITLISRDLNKLVDCQIRIQEQYPVQCSCDTYYLEEFYGKNCFSPIKQATDHIEKCLSDYGLENVFVSFNGGKDCTVLLHLVLGVLRVKYPDYRKPILCMYVRSPNPFPEVDRFIDSMRHFYNLDMITINNGVREGLEAFLAVRKNMKACLMGTRRGDPYSENLETFQMTDKNWPQVMRVFPLLDWHYSEIWDYLLYYQVPYCSLYDEGYTSLGSINNTKRNPNLLCIDSLNIDKENETYLPAYKLLDGSTERSGRM